MRLLHLRTICTLHVCHRVHIQLDIASLGIEPANTGASADFKKQRSSSKLMSAVTSVRCLFQQLL